MCTNINDGLFPLSFCCYSCLFDSYNSFTLGVCSILSTAMGRLSKRNVKDRFLLEKIETLGDLYTC